MAYRIAQFPMTLSDVQGHSFVASHFICNFSYSRATVKISTEVVRYAVPCDN